MSLQYNVSTLLQEPIGSTHEYAVDTRVLVDDLAPSHRQVVGSTTFLRTNDGVLVSALLRGVQRHQCSRCLQETDVPVLVELEEEFFASVDVRTGARLPAPEDREAFLIDTQQMLDLEEAVRQFWTLALPMQPLCRPDCRGLCPQCGRDLNQGACSCRPQTDERWSALRSLLVQKKGN